MNRTARHLAPAFLALALSAAAPLARAQAQSALPFDEQATRRFIAEQVAAQGMARRFDVQLGTPDARYSLPQCRRTEPFLPTGARLWGRTNLGLRCVEGGTGSILLPVTVTVWGQALVAATPLNAGIVPTAQDVREQEVELSRESPNVLTSAQELQGKTLMRPLAAGQVLHTDMLRITPVVQSGDPVRLRIQGGGFAITAAGVALASAGEGQGLRVRTDFGRILTGIARENRVVEVNP